MAFVRRINVARQLDCDCFMAESEIEEGTVSVADAKEISIGATVAAVLNWTTFFMLKEEQGTLGSFSL